MKPPSDEPAGEIVELSRFRAELGRGRRARRADAIVNADDPEAAVRALPGDEFYYVIHELGFPDALEVLQHGTSAQVQAALDFGLWDRDQVAPAEIERWLGALVETPPETIGAWARDLDVELLALLLRRRARIYDVSLEEPPDEPEGTMITTPDRLFVLDLLGSDEQQRVTQQLVDSLYRYDQNWVRKVLVGTRGDLDAELEEHAYRWRSGRMADLGFEDYYDALEVYREIDPAEVRLGDGPTTRVVPVGDEGEAPFLRVPSALAERLAAPSPFARALGGVNAPEELANLRAALVALSNRALAADRVKPGDDQAVAGVLTRLAATLDLAVEVLSRGRAEDGVRAVRTVALPRLFRLGVTLVGKVRRLAAALGRTPLGRLRPGVDLFETDDAEVLAAVDQLRPAFPRLLDDPPAAGTRPFASLADLARATAAVERAAAALGLLHLLGVRPADLTPENLAVQGIVDATALDAGVLARTALARLWLGSGGDGPAWRPLERAERADLEQRLKKLAEDRASAEDAATRLRDTVAARGPDGKLPAAALLVVDRWVAGLLAGDDVLR